MTKINQTSLSKREPQTTSSPTPQRKLTSCFPESDGNMLFRKHLAHKSSAHPLLHLNENRPVICFHVQFPAQKSLSSGGTRDNYSKGLWLAGSRQCQLNGMPGLSVPSYSKIEEGKELGWALERGVNDWCLRGQPRQSLGSRSRQVIALP